MNEQLQNTVNEILQRSIEAFNKGADWMAGQIPDVIEQLLMWHATKSFILFFVAFALSVAFALNIKRFYRFVRAELEGAEPLVSLPVAMSMFFLWLAIQELAWLQILIAPKLYILEYAAELVK